MTTTPAERSNSLLFATGISLFIVVVYSLLMVTGSLLLPDALLGVLILAQLVGMLLPALVAIRLARRHGLLEAPDAAVPARRWLAPCLVVMVFGLFASLLLAMLWLRIIEPIGAAS